MKSKYLIILGLILSLFFCVLYILPIKDSCGLICVNNVTAIDCHGQYYSMDCSEVINYG